MTLIYKPDYPMSRDAILDYLSYLPISPTEADMASARICFWSDLQDFIAALSGRKPPYPPVSKTDFPTYGLAQTSPTQMLLRHVFY